MKDLKSSLSASLAIVACVSLCAGSAARAEETPQERAAVAQESLGGFVNPLGAAESPDPFVTWDSETGYYYLLYTRGKDLAVFRSKTIGGLRDGESTVIYVPRDEDVIFGAIWAPEMHKAPNGKWYVYTSGLLKKGNPWGPKRLFILESKTSDPFDGFVFKGRPAPDLFAIDPTVMTWTDGRQYICYSEINPQRGQVLVIRELENPWTFGPRQAEIARAELPWEKLDQRINEGAFFIRSPDGKRLFIVYSANGCWCDDYALGVLEHTGGDLCDAKNWRKSAQPLLVKGRKAFGPGHASFFRSPDGKTLWCAYHALRVSNPSRKPATRWLNVQRVDFDDTGYPVMGVACGEPVCDEIKVDEPFEQALSSAWKGAKDKAWRIEPGVGRKGSSALVWEVAETNAAQPELQLPLGWLTPGRQAEATFWVKTENLKGKVEGTIAWSDRKTGKWLGGSGGPWFAWGDKRNEKDADGWTKLRILTPTISSPGGQAILELYMSRGARGRVIIDDLQIRLVSEKHVGVVSSSAYRGQFAKGNVRLAAQVWLPVEGDTNRDIGGVFDYENAEGRRVTVPARRQTSAVMVADVPAEAFRMGRQTIAFMLKDNRLGKIFGRGATEVTRLAEMPRRKAYLDEFQRLVVDGKPFFPIGMWWGKTTMKTIPDALERYVKGPFNTVLSYDDGITVEEMDRYHRHGLKVLVANKDYFCKPERMGCTFPPSQLTTKEDEVRFITEQVRRLQDHPALLGWYTCDEIPGISAWRLEEHYRLLCEIDDGHIQFADTADHAATDYFLNAADVVQPDPFFGQDAGKHSMKYIFDRCHDGHDHLRGVRGNWAVVDDFFALAWDSPGKPWRLPTVQETRALVWIPISLGANGLMQYSYGQFLDRVFVRKQVPPEAFDRQFEILCKVSGEVRDLTNVLLLPPGPEVTPDDKPVSARTYSDGTNVYLLVCNAADKESAGRLMVKGLRGAAETVYGEGRLTAGAEGVCYDLPPLGVALVRFGAGFRPPAVPLAVNDPYLSLWSPADRLTDAETMHWSRDAQPLSVVGEVKGRQWRFCGAEPKEIPAAKQLSVAVHCCETVYAFEADGERVELRFSTPFLPGEWEAFARPVTYLTVKGAKAKVTISPAFATDDDTVAMTTNATTVAGCPAVSFGRAEPKYLESGDRVRPNGGRMWLVDGGDRFLLAFDAVRDMTFLSQEVKAWWRRDGKPFEAMLGEALADYPRLMRAMAAFDAKMAQAFERVGGARYARLAELAWRQSYGAGKLVASPEGEMLYFSKENTSNGCAATVDILYPQLPHLMLGGAALVRAAMLPDLLYAVSDGWTFGYAPHDLGRFPCADRQRYGMWKNAKGELGPDADRMPVEECGNMILCLYALARMEGNADFAGRFWPSVAKWAAYLEKTGFDPENQLCTDDFAGHLAHNANLSLKSLAAFEAYARLADLRGEKATAERFRNLAAVGAAEWGRRAGGGKAGVTTLAFGAADTWSLKYNLAFAKAMGIDLLPADVVRREVAAYLAFADRYGTPLDNRTHWCKVDWLVWCATLAEKRSDFEKFISPVYDFLCDTTDRVAFPDLYYTETALCPRFGKEPDRFVGFNARPVVGGVYLPCLQESGAFDIMAGIRK